MKPTRPILKVPGDDAARTMWHNSYVAAYSAHRVLWRFGFQSGSPQAKAFKMTMAGPPLWVLCEPHGHVVQKFVGTRHHLPHGMAQLLNK